jgi:hypothetical protein
VPKGECWTERLGMLGESDLFQRRIGLGHNRELTDAQELALPHSPRQVLLPSTSTRSLPETAHLLYSPTSSVILHLSPTAPNLTISELPTTPPPPPITDDDGGALIQSSGSADKEATSTGSGLGIGLGGLGGYVGLGGKTVSPVGICVASGEVMLAREGEAHL